MANRFKFICLLLLTLPLPAQQTAGTLPTEVWETSGLVYYDGSLVTHNDSGNDPVLYVVDTDTREIVRTVSVTNATNSDWEDMAQDGQYLYIGDIGNNMGNRQDLRVYRISKEAFDQGDEVSAEVISFAYEDQADFTAGANSDWDAEALVVFGDQLVVFTKQWQSNGTAAYAFPAIVGEQTARHIGSYEIQGLVTGGCFNAHTGLIYLVGYTQILQPFTARISGFTSEAAFGGEVLREDLNLGLAQLEAIAPAAENTYYLTSERFVNNNPPITLDATLFLLQTDDNPAEQPPEEPPDGENPPEEPPSGEEPEDEESLILHRQFGTRVLHYELNREEELFGRAIFDTGGRRLQYTHATAIESNSIDLSTFGSAVYYIAFYLRGHTISKPFLLE